MVVATASWSEYKLTLTLMLKSEAAKTVIACDCVCNSCDQKYCRPMPYLQPHAMPYALS